MCCWCTCHSTGSHVGGLAQLSVPDQSIRAVHQSFHLRHPFSSCNDACACNSLKCSEPRWTELLSESDCAIMSPSWSSSRVPTQASSRRRWQMTLGCATSLSQIMHIVRFAPSWHNPDICCSAIHDHVATWRHDDKKSILRSEEPAKLGHIAT